MHSLDKKGNLVCLREQAKVLSFQYTFIAPSHLSRGDQAVTAHTSSVPAPPYPIRVERSPARDSSGDARACDCQSAGPR